MLKALQPQFADLGQQKAAATIGMWAFLATEVLFFGVLFNWYALYRLAHAAAFHEGARHLDKLLGGLNTAVLLASSLTMALGVHQAAHGRGRACAGWLLATAALACVFLGIKGFEYAHKLEQGLFPWSNLFMGLYFTMTGFHALHVAIGACALVWLARPALRGEYGPEYFTPVENAGLYWHLVDVVWIFLFPLLYLIA